MDGVDLIPDGAPMPAEDGGMTGPRGRRPSELIMVVSGFLLKIWFSLLC